MPDQQLDVIFATPCLTRQLSVEYVNSLIETDRLCLANGLKPGWMMLGGDPYLAKVRNKLMTRFLEDFPGVPQFFFIDDDIGWPAVKAVEFLLRPEPIVAGAYPKKQETVDFPVMPAPHKDTSELIEDAGMFLAFEVPTGFLRIRREALEKLAENARRFKEYEPDGIRTYTEFCVMGMDAVRADGWWVGEDYDLSRRFVTLGIDIWVDPDIMFTHRGTRAWSGRLADHMELMRTRAKDSVEIPA